MANPDREYHTASHKTRFITIVMPRKWPGGSQQGGQRRHRSLRSFRRRFEIALQALGSNQIQSNYDQRARCSTLSHNPWRQGEILQSSRSYRSPFHQWITRFRTGLSDVLWSIQFAGCRLSDWVAIRRRAESSDCDEVPMNSHDQGPQRAVYP